MGKPKTRLVPPDGGYGWVIVCASALNNFIIIPLIQNFGLIFKDTFIQLGLSATQGSLIINVNSAFGMLTGLINGPLLTHYGYRKISFMGAFLIVSGVILTSFSGTFAQFLLTYGFITSLGLGLTMSSYSLAINTYFRKKKSKAIGISMTITGLGPIIMPQVINLLVQHHAIPGVTLILGAICANSFVAASLLQPVKWHMKKEVIEDENELVDDTIEEEDENGDEVVHEAPVHPPRRMSFMRSISQVEYGGAPIQKNELESSKLSINYDTEGAGIYGIDSTLGGSVISLDTIGQRRRASVVSNSKTKTQWWKSQSTVNLESSVNIFDDKTKKQNLENALNNKNQENSPLHSETVYNPDMTTAKTKKPAFKRFLLRAAKLFDLNLLKDPIYVNIMLGMSLAVFAELNFSVLTAFILSDFGLTTAEIATFMSVLGVADIIFRFLAPYIGDCLKQPPRVMYMLTLLALIATRFCLLFSTDYTYLVGVSVLLGCAKGIRTVYMSLVIPTYVPLERLAAASGIQMMVNGACILIGGPILGVVRDITGSYVLCIIIMNCVTFSTIIMWCTEFLFQKYKPKKQILEETKEQQNKLISSK